MATFAEKTLRGALAACAITVGGAFPAAAAGGNWYPYAAEVTNPPFAVDGKKTDLMYTPLTKAGKAWEICASFPHLKDAYWLGVNYGVVDEAKRLGVKLRLVEAGGYNNLSKQISQIEDCVQRGANAVVVGAISADGLNNVVKALKVKNIPVVDLVNGMNSSDIAAKALVSFYTMGQATGEYLAKKHPAGSPPAKVGWFPGPAGAGWVEAANKGFMDAVKGSALVVLDPKYGDTGKEAQGKLVEDTLQANKDLAYIVGTAVTAEASVGIVRSRGIESKVKLVSFYITPDVYEGIARGRILASPADSMVIQGRIAVDQAVRLLEGEDLVRHVGPKIFVVDSTNYKKVRFDDLLPPPMFKPVFAAD